MINSPFAPSQLSVYHEIEVAMVFVKLFGGASLEAERGPLTGPAVQRHRLALLSLLAASGASTRDRLMAYVWPERDTDHARNLLSQAVHVLRKALGEGAVLSVGDELRLGRDSLRCDVVSFERALGAGDVAGAVSLYRGPFLDGFFLPGASEFEHWVHAQRERYAQAYCAALENLAQSAERQGDFGAAVEWWRRLAAENPYSARVTIRLMEALAAEGDRAGAIQLARIHTTLLRQEFEAEPDADVVALAERLRTERDTKQRRHEAGAQQDPASDSSTGAIDERAPAADRGDASVPVPRAEESATAPVRRRRARPRRRSIFVAASAGLLLGIGGFLVAAQLMTKSLERTGGPSPVRAEAYTRSLAVLPFENLSGDPAEEYFSDGLTEELIGVLAKIRALRVVARTSAFAFKGERRDVRDIGQELGVQVLLEGSVRRVADRVRVSAQLINVEDGFHLWSETYERSGGDILAIQRDLGLAIAGALRVELTADERSRLARAGTASEAAFTLYLKGRHFWNQRTPAGYERAIHYFEQAIEGDSQYAAPYAGLAEVYALRGLSGSVGAAQAFDQVEASALRAIELDDNSAEAHSALGLYRQVHQWRANEAEREFQRSIELDPSYTQARHHYGNLLSALGRLEEGVAQKRAAVELDPLAPPLGESLAFTLLRAGHPEEALHYLNDVLEVDSTYWRAHAVLGLYYEVNDRFDDAIREYDRANELVGSAVHRTKADVARVHARAGRRTDARQLILELQAEAAATGTHEPAVATALMALGEDDAAFAWLETAYAQRHPHLTFIAGDRRYASFDNDPRFIALMRRLGVRR